MTYIALLRGINVGGKHIIKMAELRFLLSGLGFGDIQTYIQSGNIILQSDLATNEIKSRLEAGIESRFGFFVPVILRSQKALGALISGLPFAQEDIACADAASEAVSLYGALFDQAPAPEKIKALLPYCHEEERLIIYGADAYLLLHQGVRNSPLVQKLDGLGSYTMRNWNTLCRLYDMAQKG